MAVMQAPRTKRAEPPRRRAAEPVVDEPGDPRLWEIFQNLDLGEGVKVEYIQDTIVVRGQARMATSSRSRCRPGQAAANWRSRSRSASS
jgi:hypothetical protein